MIDIHFVSVSGGNSSAATLLRVFELYPKESIHPVFADTNWEHKDVYRFINDLESYIDKEIIRLNQNKTPSDISEEENMIFNSRVANCTKKLKIIPIERYIQQITSETKHSKAFLHIGFNKGDRYNKQTTNKPYGRLPSPVKNWKQKNVYVKYPLWFQPRITDPKQFIEDKGIKTPLLYDVKNVNKHVHVTNNCNSGCFKAGQKYWRGLLIIDEKTFNERMQWENKMRENPKFSNYAILTKTENGHKRAYPLEELKRDTLAIINDPIALKRAMMIDDITSDCVNECQVF